MIKNRMGKQLLLVVAVVMATVACGNNRKSSVAESRDEIYRVSQSVATNDTVTSHPASDARDNNEGAVAVKQQYEEGLEVPQGNPKLPSQILVREAYTTSYNKGTRLPNWVAWHLTPERLVGKASRKNTDFESDTDVPAPRAEDSDYYNSGYDRGHICPAADNKMSITAMQQSFLFTNMCPQAPSLNRGDWNEMEIACRNWAKKYGGIYIVSGPILYKGKHKTIGRNKVTVPEAFFKVVLRLGDEPKAIGFIYKNEDGNRPKGDYVNTVDQVERITGIDFFPQLPDDIEAKVESEADINDW